MAPYVSASELSDAVGGPGADEELALQTACDAATTMVDDWCGQQFHASTSSTSIRYYRPQGGWCLDVDPIGDSASLVVAVDTDDTGTYGTTLVVGTDFQLAPVNAAAYSPAQPWTELQLLAGGFGYWPSGSRDTVKVTARFGWPAIPAAVRAATSLIAADIWKARDAPFGIAGGNDFGAVRVQSGINRTAATLLSPYRRNAIG